MAGMDVIYGDVTRNLRSSWSSSSDSRSLFNALELYPSTSQLFEIFQYSSSFLPSESNSENQKSKTFQLSFGEFCVCVTELRKSVHESRNYFSLLSPFSQIDSGTRNSKRGEYSSRKSFPLVSSSFSFSYDVFLGGSCNPTTWRNDVAIPNLKSKSITYYNPQSSNWSPELIELEHQAKNSSQLLFFVLHKCTRNIASMIEVSYFSGRNRDMILTIDSDMNSIQREYYGETISEEESNYLSRASSTVRDIIERQGLPVFYDLKIALACTEKVVKEKMNVRDLSFQDSVSSVKCHSASIAFKLKQLREAFESLDTFSRGYISLLDAQMAFRIFSRRDLTPQHIRSIIQAHNLPEESINIDFDHFCRISVEYTAATATGDGTTTTGNGTDVTGTAKKEQGNSKSSHFCSLMLSPVLRMVSWMGDKKSHVSLRRNGSLLTSSRRRSNIRDVYLGGTNPSNGWQQSIAIPLLKKSGLTYFVSNSQVIKRLTTSESSALDNSKVLLFVIDGDKRSVSEMCEASYYIGQKSNVVLSIQQIQVDSITDGEILSDSALKDYNRGRAYLSDIANRDGIPVFEDIYEAVECAIRKCKNCK